MEDLLLTAGEATGGILIATYIWTGIWLYTCRMGLINREAPALVRKLFRLAKVAFWFGFGLRWGCEIAHHGPMDGWDALWFLNQIWCYYSLKREDDDDAWKRLRERVGAAVKSLGHRLVVVPNA